MKLKINQTAPNFKLESTDGDVFELNKIKKKNYKKKNLNKIKENLIEQIDQKDLEIGNAEINEKLKNEKVDVTLPIRPYQQGKIHPVSQVIDEISSIFSEIGFSVAEGPDVETEYNNFTALNTPDDHPARDTVSYTHLTLPTKRIV